MARDPRELGMRAIEERINGMTLNEYLNFIRRSWRKHYRRGWIRHSKEEMNALSELREIKSLKDLQRDLDRSLEILNNAKERINHGV